MSTRLITALAAFACCAAAHAETLYTLGSATAPLETDTSLTASFAAGAGAGSVSFQIAGYNTLDGDNYYIDILHVTLNGTEVFAGTWDLGGGGTDRILNNPAGGTAVHNGAQKTVDIDVPLTLAAGNNTLVLSYESPTTFEGSGRAGFQGLGDEGWGVNRLTVTGPVPEPATWALMLGGAGLVALRRRRAAV